MTTQQLEIIRKTGSIDSVMVELQVIQSMLKENCNPDNMSDILGRTIKKLKGINEDIYNTITK